MILALACEAVRAVEVTCVCHVKAQSLDLYVLLTEVLSQMLILVGSIELACGLEVIDVGDAFFWIMS